MLKEAGKRRVEGDIWSPREIPVGPIQEEWEQVKPIPVGHTTETQEGVSVEHLQYSYECCLLVVQVCRPTISQAEAKMRDSLIFDIKFGEGKDERIKTPPTPVQKAMGVEVAAFFQRIKTG